MLFKPAVDGAHQPATAMLGGIQSPRQIIHQPVLFGFAGGLPLQNAFAGQAAAQLNNDLRLRQFTDRLAVTQPQVGAGERLPGLREHIANQRPAEGFRPLGHLDALFRAHPSGDHHAAFLPPEKPVALLFTFQMQRVTQPGLVALPPITELLLPLGAGVVHIAIQRFGKRTVNMNAAAV